MTGEGHTTSKLKIKGWFCLILTGYLKNAAFSHTIQWLWQ
jgi:hypothetical protein